MGGASSPDVMPFPSADLDKPPGLSAHDQGNDDVVMDDLAKPKEDPTVDAVNEIEPIDWKDEVRVS